MSTKPIIEEKQQEYNSLKEITIDFDVSEEKKEIARLVKKVYPRVTKSSPCSSLKTKRISWTSSS